MHPEVKVKVLQFSKIPSLTLICWKPGVSGQIEESEGDLSHVKYQKFVLDSQCCLLSCFVNID